MLEGSQTMSALRRCLAGACALTASMGAAAPEEPVVNFHHPSWSPDGKYIAFDSNAGGDREIYLLKLADKSIIRLTDNEAEDSHPYWSKDGEKLVFESTRDGDYEIYTMSADGSAQQRITVNPAADLLGSWSPDGRYLAFQSDRDGDYEVYVVDLTTGEETRLTADPGYDGVPVWSPARGEIAFQTTRNGRSEIFIADPEGNARPLAAGLETSQSLAWWSADGERVIFRTGNGKYASAGRHGGDYEVVLDKTDVNGIFSLSPDNAKATLFTDPAPDGADIVLVDLASKKSANITKPLRGSAGFPGD